MFEKQTETLALPSEIITRIEHIRQQHLYATDVDLQLVGEGGYTAPNTQLLYDTIIAMTLNKNILLQGPTGSGKTRLAEELSHLFQKPMHMINCSVDLDAEALLGHKTIIYKDGQAHIDFVPGPVIQAMEKGHLLYIDEINMAKPDTLPILNGILDYRRRITNPFTGDVIRAKEGFGVIAAINIGYIGTVSLNEALKNRFIIIDVPYLQGEPLHQLLAQQSLQKDEKALKILVQLSEDLVFQATAGQLAEDAASIRALLDAADLSVYLPLDRAVQRAIVAKLENEREQAIVLNALETLLP